MSPSKFIQKNYKITLNEAREKQAELKELMNKLNNDYNPRSTKKKNKREKKEFLELWIHLLENCLMWEMKLLIFLKK